MQLWIVLRAKVKSRQELAAVLKCLVTTKALFSYSSSQDKEIELETEVKSLQALLSLTHSFQYFRGHATKTLST